MGKFHFLRQPQHAGNKRVPGVKFRLQIMVPTGTGNQGKPGKMGRHFPVREKSGNFVKTGKVREFCPKY